MSTRDWCIAFVALIALLLFLAPSFAFYCWDGQYGSFSSYSQNSTADDACLRHNGTNNGAAWVAAVYGFGGDYELSESDYIQIGDDADFSPTDLSWCTWVNIESHGVSTEHIFTKFNFGTNDAEWTMYDWAGINCWIYEESTDDNCLTTTTVVLDLATYYHICCTWEDGGGGVGNISIYVNGTFNSTNSGGCAAGVHIEDGAADVYLGRRGDVATPLYYDGILDEAPIFNYTLNASAVAGLFVNNSVVWSAPAGPAPGTGCTVTLNTPADDDHTNDQTPAFNQSNIVCYGANMASRCWVTMNGTQSGDNSTSLTNNSAFGILANTSKAEGSYEWNITCLQGAVTNTTATRTLVIDITAPQTFIYAPTASTTIYYGDLTYLDVAGFDIYMFNLTAEIFNGTGVTALATYTNDTGAPPWFNLSNEYVAGNDLYPGVYWVNASSMDSHTGKKWKPDHIETGADYIKVWKNGKTVKSSWLWNAEPDYELLEDRVKWSTVAQCDDMGDIKVKFNILCSQEVRIIEGSEYAGHYVCAEMWGDFQDLADDGYDVKLVYESPVSLEVEIEKENAGDPFEWIWLDPATGGLNLNFSLSNFTVLTDSAIEVNTTSFYVGTVGYLIIYYTNITTDALITGANCSYNITDPYSNLEQGNATEGAAFYLANYTPTFTGLHSFAVMCNSSGWLTLRETGTFNVASAPATTSIQVVPNSERMWTSATCNDSQLAYVYENRICFGSSCETVTVTEYEFCPLGCLQEGGALCRESLITSNPALVLLIAVILLAIVIFGLYAWARRVK